MFSVGRLTISNRFLEIIAYLYGSYSPEIGEKISLSKSFSGHLKRKKNPTASKPRWVGGVKGLGGTATNKELFGGFPWQ